MAPNYKVIGTRPIRHDGVDKVTGRALYGVDFQIGGLLHGRLGEDAIKIKHLSCTLNSGHQTPDYLPRRSS